MAELIPNITLAECLHRVYPYDILYQNSNESKQAVRHMFKKLSLKQQVENSSKKILHINRQERQATVDYEMNGKQYKITVLYSKRFTLNRI